MTESGKRKPSEAPTKGDDTSLQSVARALANVTRVGTGATFATGASARFPVPALAFQGDEEDALRLPLGRDDVQKIKARGVISQQTEEAQERAKATAWTVDSGQLETRNPQWARFLDECIASKRKRLGIAPSAVVDVALRSMVLAEAGARLVDKRDGRDGDARGRRDGAFGTLLVVLPNVFRGGAFVIRNPWPREEVFYHETSEEEEDDDEEEEEVISWRTTEEESDYNVVFEAFHNRCEIVAESLVDGTALCLVYDLRTTTPTEIPLYSGSAAIQQSVHAALAEYFDVVPAAMAKRLKISSEAWRTITEFAAERHFVYLVGGEIFDDLRRDEANVAQSLAAFCKASRGQYVLYLAKALCSRSNSESGPDDSERMKETRLTLTGPWIKHNASMATSCSPVYVNPTCDVAPMGQVDRIPRHDFERVDTHAQILTPLYRNAHCVEVYTTHALVVQPVSVEQRQLAQIQIPEMLKMLRTTLDTSRDDALRYARRVVYYRPEWPVRLTDVKLFAEFVQLVIAIDDCELFNDLLRTVHLYCTDRPETLFRAVYHFGIANCFDTLLERIRSTPTWRGRVNLVVAVVNQSVSTERVDRLLDVLLGLHPWTAVRVESSSHRGNPYHDALEYEAFRDLLTIGNLSSPQRAMDVASVAVPNALVRVVIPALVWMIRTYETTPLVRDLLRHVSRILTEMMPAIRNESFASIRLPDHCSKCSELQAFVSSTATESTVQCTDTAERDHVQAVMRGQSWYPARMAIDLPDATTVRLTKHPGVMLYGLWTDARQHEASMRKLLEGETTQDNDVAEGLPP